jgi:cardiolipin synthase
MSHLHEPKPGADAKAEAEHDRSQDLALEPLAWYAQRKPVFTGGNTAQLLRGGAALFPAMQVAIEGAKASVWIACYMVSPLGQSSEVLEAVIRAARRGVAVHLVFDAVGSDAAPASLWSDLRQAGVQLAQFRPLHRVWGLSDPGSWRRMHMKLCVVDEQLAFVGGINLIDDRFDLAHGWTSEPRLDYAVQVSGPVVTPVLHTAKAMWTRAQFGRDWRDELTHLAQEPGRMQRLRALWLQARLRLHPREQTRLAQGVALRSPMRCAFVLRDNLRQRRTIEQASLQALHLARDRIDLVTPYFYPRRAMRRALCEAASRGVKVRLLFQGKADFRIAALAAQVLYAELQLAGVRIHEYQGAFLHAKVLRVDEEWTTIGSSNLDPLSMVLNLEANLVIKDREFVRSVHEALKVDFGRSLEVPSGGDAKPGLAARLRRRLVAWLAQTYLRLAGATGRY